MDFCSSVSSGFFLQILATKRSTFGVDFISDLVGSALGPYGLLSWLIVSTEKLSLDVSVKSDLSDHVYMRNGKCAGESDSKSWTFTILGDWSSVSDFFKNDLFAYCVCGLFCWGLRLYLGLDDSSSAARFVLSLNKRMFSHSGLFLLSGIFRPFCLVGFLCVSFLTAFQDWPTILLSLVLFCHFNYACLCHWSGFNRSFRCFACCFWLRFCFCWCTWQRWWLVHLRW